MARRRMPMKLKAGRLNISSILRSSTSLYSSISSKIQRVRTSEQNMLERMPMMSVTANPRTASVPKEWRMTPVMRVVILASTMVTKARS